ncbi:poly(3-hydroxyalkanoate) depolymerase [Hyphomonas polymorpha PS728]|uniref:Poly(3-hydroxyalkanoate) depolymerase n=1 Tax=Hyphomonas polymorpha PS728 TaxID=1280954 RepID=A0A062VLE3_9PROT|nr:alpha/beta fold hydrolase [Hyphomonas polymorpha]KCZ98929.1 poly(3-hydroxyalkanoate) depolymerase [Hyphomonas polymorpha PS728]
MVSNVRTPLITMEDVDGVLLRVAHWPVEGQGAGRPLVFFNGIGANLELASGLGDMFPDREILTLDVPGVGGSPVTQWPYRHWMLARWIRKLVDRYGIDEMDVMGVSWGGALAQQFAFQYRSRVKRLILCATTAGVTMIPGRPASLSKMVDTRRYSDPEFMRENFAKLYGDAADGAAGGHIDSLMPPDPKGYLYQMLAFAGWSSLPFIRFLRMPALVIMGDADTIVPLANGHILNFALPDARLEVIEGGGHLFLVTRADETAAIIQGFLDEGEAALSDAA